MRTLATSRRSRLATALAATMLLATMTACAHDDGEDVASASGASSASTKQSGSAKASEDFVQCLIDAGVEAGLDKDGLVSVGGPDEGVAASVGADGEISKLELAGVDITAQYDTCLEKVPDYNPSDEPKKNEKDAAIQAEAAQKWVECVRKNGIPDMKDPVDGGVFVPETVTGDAMTSALAACPLTDEFTIVFTGTPDQSALDALAAAQS